MELLDLPAGLLHRQTGKAGYRGTCYRGERGVHHGEIQTCHRRGSRYPHRGRRGLGQRASRGAARQGGGVRPGHRHTAILPVHEEAHLLLDPATGGGPVGNPGGAAAAMG